MIRIRKTVRHMSLKIGLGIYVMIWLVLIIGSICLPLDTFDHETILADLPPSVSYLDIPKTMKPDHIQKIANGITFGVVLDTQGEITAWGDIPFDETDIKDTSILHIAAGAKHIVFADINGNIEELGEVPSTYKKLTDEERNAIKQEGIREVYATDTYSACLTNQGTLYYWGMISALETNGIAKEHQGHIVDVVLHPYHILYLLDDGSIHLSGRDDILKSTMPEEVKTKTITKIAMNADSILIEDRDERLYSWGESINELPSGSGIKDIVSTRHDFYILYDDGTLLDVHANKIRNDIHNVYANYYQTYAVGEHDIYAFGKKGFLLGSDAYGRDILTRLLHGGFATMLIGLPACLISLILAVIFGLCSGYYGGKWDHICLGISDCIASIPFLPIVITLSAFLMDNVEGYSRILIIMLLYGCVSWTSLARLIRSKVLSEKEKDYILYEQAIGASDARILIRHIFPSTFSIIAADITSLYASAMLMEASLSFLGFGIPSILPSWGNMLQAAQSMHAIEELWWQWFFPAVSIFLTILSVHLITEAIRKDVNPKE